MKENARFKFKENYYYFEHTNLQFFFFFLDTNFVCDLQVNVLPLSSTHEMLFPTYLYTISISLGCRVELFLYFFSPLYTLLYRRTGAKRTQLHEVRPITAEVIRLCREGNHVSTLSSVPCGWVALRTRLEDAPGVSPQRYTINSFFFFFLQCLLFFNKS